MIPVRSISNSAARPRRSESDARVPAPLAPLEPKFNRQRLRGPVWDRRVSSLRSDRRRRTSTLPFQATVRETTPDEIRLFRQNQGRHHAFPQLPWHGSEGDRVTCPDYRKDNILQVRIVPQLLGELLPLQVATGRRRDCTLVERLWTHESHRCGIGLPDDRRAAIDGHRFVAADCLRRNHFPGCIGDLGPDMSLEKFRYESRVPAGRSLELGAKIHRDGIGRFDGKTSASVGHLGGEASIGDAYLRLRNNLETNRACSTIFGPLASFSLTKPSSRMCGPAESQSDCFNSVSVPLTVD